MGNDTPKMRVAPAPAPTEHNDVVEMRRTPSRSQAPVEQTNLQRLNERQQDCSRSQKQRKQPLISSFLKDMKRRLKSSTFSWEMPVS